MIVIVPNVLADAINKRLDIALNECPDAKPDREALYGQLLSFFNEHGYIPNFTLGKRDSLPCKGRAEI